MHNVYHMYIIDSLLTWSWGDFNLVFPDVLGNLGLGFLVLSRHLPVGVRTKRNFRLLIIRLFPALSPSPCTNICMSGRSCNSLFFVIILSNFR